MVAPNSSTSVTKRAAEDPEEASFSLVTPKPKTKLSKILPSIILGTSVPRKPRVGDEYQALIPPIGTRNTKRTIVRGA
jgi:hypothetical protein